MTLHRYLLRYTTFRCFEAMKEQRTPFAATDLEEVARRNKVLLEKEVRAFTAVDAITQLNASEGFGGQQLPFIFFVDALPDVQPVGRDRSKHSWENWTEKEQAQAEALVSVIIEEEAKCACGAVAVQWRLDTPVCGNTDCLRKAEHASRS